MNGRQWNDVALLGDGLTQCLSRIEDLIVNGGDETGQVRSDDTIAAELRNIALVLVKTSTMLLTIAEDLSSVGETAKPQPSKPTTKLKAGQM